MDTIRRIRSERGISQRELARRAGLSFKGLQLLEVPGHDARLSTIERVAEALGLPRSGVRAAVERFLAEPADSAHCASLRIVEGGFDSWRIHLFDFVDRFRAAPAREFIRTPPAAALDPRLAALFASVVETLCVEVGSAEPDWTADVVPLPRPWFVSGVENLKATALVESPARFRRRNIFVLDNFLARA